MTKLLTVDDLEIEFAKQHKSHACKWCTYITVRSGQNTKMLMMIKTNLKPHATFTFDEGNIVKKSKKTLKDILKKKEKLTMTDLARKLNDLETTLFNANNYALSLEKRIMALEKK